MQYDTVVYIDADCLVMDSVQEVSGSIWLLEVIIVCSFTFILAECVTVNHPVMIFTNLCRHCMHYEQPVMAWANRTRHYMQ